MTDADTVDDATTMDAAIVDTAPAPATHPETHMKADVNAAAIAASAAIVSATTRMVAAAAAATAVAHELTDMLPDLAKTDTLAAHAVLVAATHTMAEAGRTVEDHHLANRTAAKHHLPVSHTMAVEAVASMTAVMTGFHVDEVLD